jgi:hypothetical protein
MPSMRKRAAVPSLSKKKAEEPMVCISALWIVNAGVFPILGDENDMKIRIPVHGKNVTTPWVRRRKSW